MKRNVTGALKPVVLPAPVFTKCKTVFEALKLRRTTRTVSDKKIPLQMLSDILWAAQGVNRNDGPFGGPGRTAGSASNSQEILVYVAMEEGTYLYEPETHRMIPVKAGDIRGLAIGAGQRRMDVKAPIRLIYVVDIDKLKKAPFQEPGLYDAEVQKSYYLVDTGLIAQNVYLAASALGLASWFHNCNKAGLAQALGLKPQHRALFGQTLGYAEN
jgi:SagB-type dehydrogenase family enzyme